MSNSISSDGLVTWTPEFTGDATITLTVTGCGSPVVRAETITVIPFVSATPLTCAICDLPSPSRCEGSGTTQFISEISDANTVDWTITDDNPSVSSQISSEGLVTWNSSFTGQATIQLTVTGCGQPVTETKTILVKTTYNVPTLTLSGPSFVCPGTEAEFNITVHNASSSPQIEFLINDELLASGQSTSFLVEDWKYENASVVRCRIPNPNECLAAQGPQSTLLMVYTQLDGVVDLVPQEGNFRCKGPGTTQFTVSENLTDYVWSITDVDPGTSIDQTGLVTWDANETGYPEVAIAAEDCPSVATSMFYYIEAPPPAPTNQMETGCNWEEITLTAKGGQNSINWYFDDELVHTGTEYDAGTFPVVDTYAFFTEAVSPVGCKSETKGSVELQITPFCDDDKLNWIETKGLDGEGDIYSHSKQYFDLSGRPLQTQTKLFSPDDGVKILASQGLRDQFGREIGNTLTAPVQFNDFNFYYGFALNGSSAPYSFQDFDGGRLNNPDPVNSTEPGTLGWYYSNNNTMEDHVPVTGYPYSRTEYYPDGTEEVRRAASPGDQHRMGMGHEILTGTFPVFSELDDYLARRLIALPGVVQDGSLVEEAIQTVTRDENGEYTVSIADKSGNVLMTSRRGPITLLPITNSVTSSGNPESANYRKMTYFYILHDQVVTILGATDFVAENIVTNERKMPGETFADAGGKWPVGFYRILLPSPSEVTLTYTNRYHEVSYYFYDDAGRLKSSVSPNGLYTWVVAPADKQEPAYSTIDKTTYTYDHQSLLVETIEPDAGRTVYQYRKDGKIRFSQNALQRGNEQTGNSKGKFSYTHYDISGRPIESGQYIGTTIMFSSLSSQLEFSDQVEFANADKNDWVKTQYDYTDSSIPHLPADLTQEFVRGAVSWTENINIKRWYSYDESGRLAWMAQKPNALDRCFIAKYSYDFLGNVIEVINGSYQSGILMFPFYHHYDYDQDKRLSKVHTSVDGFTHKRRASYEYYLHGPLKRVELGDQIQGIDFVYNIHGWLTQINHPEGGSNDPGKDGEAGPHSDVKADVFGMVLDYYESSLQGVFQTSGIMDHNRPDLFHKIPLINDKETSSAIVRKLPVFFKSELLKTLEQIRRNVPQESERIKVIKEEIQKVGRIVPERNLNKSGLLFAKRVSDPTNIIEAL